MISEILSYYQNCHIIWGWNLAVGKNVSEQQFRRYWLICKITIFGHETWQLAKTQQVAHTLSFHSRGSKLSLFSLYGQLFPRYGLSIKITIFGHGAWPFVIVLGIAHLLSFYPRGATFSLYEQWLGDTGQFLNLPLFGHKISALGKGTEIDFYPTARNDLDFALHGRCFRDMGWFSKFPCWVMKLGNWQKLQKLHMHSFIQYFYPRSSKLSLFLLYGQSFVRYGLIFKLPYLDIKLRHWQKFKNCT